MDLRFLTSGESHGPELNIILEGIPSNMPLSAEDIDTDLKRRQGGYGRGGRMKIETDKVIFTAGIRHARTFGGAPIGMKLLNKDHQKWLNVMSAAAVDESDPKVKEELEEKLFTNARPGHADLAGAMKYNVEDIRDILERSSARETTSRVAVGGVCKKLLSLFGINIFSHVLRIGEIGLDEKELQDGLIEGKKLDRMGADFKKFRDKVEDSEVRCYSDKLSEAMKKHIDAIRKEGDSLGGLIEVFATGVPIGLGSHVQWDRKLDGDIAKALMSVHTVKSVEIGLGKDVAYTAGTKVHDELFVNESFAGHQDASGDADSIDFHGDEYKKPFDFRYFRNTNNLGGLEGGMTNGMPVTCKVAVKPIPTVVKQLNSVDIATKSQSKSHYERSDVCVVPAAGVVLEAMLAYALARSFLEKFGGDSIEEVARNYQGYLEQTYKR